MKDFKEGFSSVYVFLANATLDWGQENLTAKTSKRLALVWKNMYHVLPTIYYLWHHPSINIYWR